MAGKTKKLKLVLDRRADGDVVAILQAVADPTMRSLLAGHLLYEGLRSGRLSLLAMTTPVPPAVTGEHAFDLHLRLHQGRWPALADLWDRLPSRKKQSLFVEMLKLGAHSYQRNEAGMSIAQLLESLLRTAVDAGGSVDLASLAMPAAPEAAPTPALPPPTSTAAPHPDTSPAPAAPAGSRKSALLESLGL